jgi:hypothetical protein
MSQVTTMQTVSRLGNRIHQQTNGQESNIDAKVQCNYRQTLLHISQLHKVIIPPNTKTNLQYT